jgi:hypothetical protein
MTSALSLQSSTTSVDEQSPLSQLPPEAIVQVLLHLKIQDIAALGLTCKHFREVSHDNRLWSTLFVRDFPTSTISIWTTSVLTLTRDIAPGANLAAYKKEHFSRALFANTPKIMAATDILKKMCGIRL